MKASCDPGGTLATDRCMPPIAMRQEHSFTVSPLGPPVRGISPGIPCPVAPTELTSLALRSGQTWDGCAQTFVAVNTIRRPHNLALCRLNQDPPYWQGKNGT